MTDIQYALDKAEHGAKTFLGRYGSPSWGEVCDVFSQAKVIALEYLNSERYRREYLFFRVLCGLVDWARRERRRTYPLIRDQEPETVEWDNPEPVEEGALTDKELVAKMMRELDSDSRAIVEAVYFQGVDQREVARRVGLSESGFSRRLDAIRRDLRKKFWEIS